MRGKSKKYICTGLMLLICAVFAGASTAFAADSTKAPGTPKLQSVKSKAVKKLTVTWEKVKNADGYEISFRATDTDEAKTKVDEEAKTLTVKASAGSSDTLTAVIKDLPGRVTYEVKVRAYRETEAKQTDSKSVQAGKVCSSWSDTKEATVKHNKWSDLQDKYSEKEKVRNLIFVKYKGNSKAKLILYDKTEDNTWEKVLSCNAYTGQNGLDKSVEGDRRTPTGVYNLTRAFGIKKDPGSKMKYIKVNNNHYWCGDREHYNQMINIKNHPHSCRGEHLINYTKQYAYAMAIDYNKSCTYGKGSAIFLHCYGYNPYTLGCVAVSESNMKTILKTCEKKTKICIYKK